MQEELSRAVTQIKGMMMKGISGFFRSLVARSSPSAPAALTPKDFPLTADGTKLSKPDGEPVAVAKDPATATEIVDRLNSDEEQNDQDRWSA